MIKFQLYIRTAYTDLDPEAIDFVPDYIFEFLEDINLKFGDSYIYLPMLPAVGNFLYFPDFYDSLKLTSDEIEFFQKHFSPIKLFISEVIIYKDFVNLNVLIEMLPS